MHERRIISLKLFRICLVGSTVIAAGPALAQAGTADLPLTGQSSTRGNRNLDKLSIEPGILVAYDNNILRRNPDLIRGPTDNSKYSPNIGFGVGRQFGRTQIRLSGSLGYEFNSRFKYLNRERIVAHASIQLPVGSQCPVSLTADHQQFQYDLVDTEQTGGSLQKIENFSADLACTRPGFSPSFGAVYRTVGNSGNDIANSSYVEGHGGIKLTVPSLGSLTVGGQLAKITRPNVKRSLGREDNTDITRAYLSLDRAVAPRLQFSANIGYLRAVPVDPAVAIFSGLSFQGKLAYAFTPQLRLTLEGQQDVQNSSGVSSTYVVRKEVRGGMDFDIFNKTTISLTAAHVTRRFVGNDNGTGSALSSDILDTMSLRMNREIGRRLRLGVTANLQKRDANLALYDYDSASVSATLGAKF